MRSEEYIAVGKEEQSNTGKKNLDPVLRSQKRGWSRFSITIEPILFVVNFIQTFTIGVSIDLLQANVCHQNFNLTWEECMSIGSLDEEGPSSIKTRVESLTADVNLINSEIQSAFPVILSLLIGPWSDTNGRKPFLKWALRGYTLFYILWGVLSLIPDIPVMYFVIPAIPLSLSGGWVAIIVCTWSYLADVYEEHERPFRLSVLLFSGLIGSVLGNALSAKVFYASGSIGYQVIFFSSAAISAATLLYTTYILKESVTRQVVKTNFFNLKHLKSIIVALILKPKHKLIISLLTMAILSSEITANAADRELVYLVGKSTFNWTLGDYNLFSAIVTTLSALSPIIGVKIFHSLLHWSNYAVLLAFSFLMMLMNILKAASVNLTMFWIAACGLKISSLLGPYIDTEMSKIVHEEDLGKAYAFSSLVDALSPVISIPAFTALYKYLLTFDSKESALQVFYMKAGLSAITFISSLILYILNTSFRDQFWLSAS